MTNTEPLNQTKQLALESWVKEHANQVCQRCGKQPVRVVTGLLPDMCISCWTNIKTETR